LPEELDHFRAAQLLAKNDFAILAGSVNLENMLGSRPIISAVIKVTPFE
jgi:hypothetical protein